MEYGNRCHIKVNDNGYWQLKFMFCSNLLSSTKYYIIDGHQITHNFPKYITQLVFTINSFFN